jgi:hypothetical protein
LQVVVQQDSQGGAGFAVYEAHHGLGEVDNTANPKGLPLATTNPSSISEKPMTQPCNPGQFPANQGNIGFCFARVMKVGSGHMPKPWARLLSARWLEANRQ